ncbi:hypothetical protein IW262DRAFT_1279096, partial [Armillaria fumosa]
QLPIWYHKGFKEKTQIHYGTKIGKCLMNMHKVETAGDAVDIVVRLSSTTHKTRKDCKCRDCVANRGRKYANLHKCAVMAEQLLDGLMEKWDLQWSDHIDGLSLMLEEKEQNIQAKNDNELIRFNPDINRDCSLTEGIHIFTNNWDTCPMPAE